MKGLVFRELYLARKNILLTAFFGLLVIMIGILIRLSMLYGNLSKLPGEEYSTADTILFNTFTYLPVAVLTSLSGAMDKTIFSDCASKWTLFGYASPVSEYRYVGAKFLLFGLVSCGGFALSLINAAVMCILCDRKFDSNMFLFLLCTAMLIIVLTATQFTLAYKFRTAKKLGICLGVVIAVIYGGITAVTSYFASWIEEHYPDLSEEESAKIIDKYLHDFIGRAKEVITDAMPFIPLIFIAVMILLYFLSVKALKRREH